MSSFETTHTGSPLYSNFIKPEQETNHLEDWSGFCCIIRKARDARLSGKIAEAQRLDREIEKAYLNCKGSKDILYAIESSIRCGVEP